MQNICQIHFSSRTSRRAGILLLAIDISTAYSREPAPEFELRDARGKRQRLSDYSGNVVLLNFWATWRQPCRTEIPWLNELHAEFSGKGFSVIGVAMDERGWRAVTPFLAQYRIDYPVLLGNANLARQYRGLDKLPLTLFLDRQGGIVAPHNAIIDKGSLRKIVRTLLSEPRESEPRGR